VVPNVPSLLRQFAVLGEGMVSGVYASYATYHRAKKGHKD
jgi:hypothetical protein